MVLKQNDIFRNVDGNEVGTGLWVPDEKDNSIPSLLMALGTRLDRKDAAEIIADPRRVPARKRFPGKQFIKNQGRRGSCNGYAIAKTIEKMRVARGLAHIPLSGEFIYAGLNGGVDRGSGLKPGKQFAEMTGTVPESMVPHQEYLMRRIPKEVQQQAFRFKGLECYAAPDEENLIAGHAYGFLAIVAVQFSSAMQRLDRNGVAGSSRGPGNHSVGTDDLRFRNGRAEFDFVNSHGLQYGEEGRAWITWEEHLAQTSERHQFWLLRSTTDDPQTDPTIEVTL